ncbi:putative tumor necrosis factor receptor superfamily member 1A-like [Scophthalmus maximus]|uniref:Putative tumor necrosis factor receptor superfamily member 1A-like n=1 Tax=Scophthalmus maximus TaxID=52904 RepID=A0A2U9AXN3_SCOMX|nr:tumor necrosis factor receptor superfamily member 1A [Scophthalmus maximus]XP_035498278.1 tumor necrosis factor receptor superfamily member 1A [Scophthalmus maximus]AWO96414.1 putative tumor necrosis factor receptor superfamily member 1A-like [Scophthalmus maximus]
MEEAGHRGRRNKKASVGTILVLMYMFIPTRAWLQPSEEHSCEIGEYPTEEGVCCNKCSPGFKLVEKCHATGQRSNCTPCPTGQFMDQMNYFSNCRPCKRCKTSHHEYKASACERHQNTICRCDDGYYKFYIDSGLYQCRKCSQCGRDEKEKLNCTPLKDTVCECKQNYYSVNNKCEPCKTCTAECKHLCSSPSTLNTKASDTGKDFLINIIAGVVTVALVLLVLVVLITHVATKRFTKKKLLKPPSKPPDDSPDSCEEVLFSSEELSVNISVEAIPKSPVGEQQTSNLPDCVPLEIKLADLIYSVLDLVPVLQVKQLVRTLGVKDTEIDQAELDHKSCREAHYKMLRLWAERGSRAGGGRPGGMLHWPLLQELLDKMRNMGLGGVAEELEMKFATQ